ncbi:MAG TPA: penicillin-binding transpeptidase domain-containing protein [Gaiellales bacterium]
MVGARSTEHGPRRRLRRLLVVGAAVLATGAAAVAGYVALRGAPVSIGSSGPDPRSPVRLFTSAWVAGDFRTMYSQLTPAARAATTYRRFVHTYRQAAATGSLTAVTVEQGTRVANGAGTVPVVLRSSLFGALSERLVLPLVQVRNAYRIAWEPQLAWPGLARGERLERVSRVPDRRGRILSNDRQALAHGPANSREYPQGAPFYTITGFVRAPQTRAARRARVAAGWPAGAKYGQGGLEGSLDRVLGGAPRIDLVGEGVSGTRLLARHHGRRPRDVVTTLDPTLQADATAALAGRYGGITILDARNGAVRAAAGIAMDATQPPGSTFKIVTASAALTAGAADLDSYYAPARYADVGGFKLNNFHHEVCGGTLLTSFANSCNSVFGPVAVATGGKELYRTAVKFGFNTRPHIAYPVDESVMPSRTALRNSVILGVAGIGQAGVAATPLEMASVGQVIAGNGLMHPPWIARFPRRFSDHRRSRRVISRRVAGKVAEMMRAVVSYGTGTSASSSLATVNGKTGTAEVGPDIKTDAWFVGYAPAEAPKVVVSVLIVHGGVGGEVAAPIARTMIEDALQR